MLRCNPKTREERRAIVVNLSVTYESLSEYLYDGGNVQVQFYCDYLIVFRKQRKSAVTLQCSREGFAHSLASARKLTTRQRKQDTVV